MNDVIRPCCGSCKHFFVRDAPDLCQDCKDFEYYEQNPYNCEGCKWNIDGVTSKACLSCTDFENYEKEKNNNENEKKDKS